MSSFTVLGYFGLAAGRIASVPAQIVGGKSTTYAHYTSSFTCSDNSSAPADIRLFAPSSKPLCPDNTIALILANAFIPPSIDLPILLDVIHFFPIPGNPGDSFAYEATLPDFPYPIIFAVGHVSSNLSNTIPKTFNIFVSSYVRGMAQDSTLQCIFANQKRWAKVPALTPNSCIYVSGVSSSISLDSVLSFSVDSISISLGPRNSPTPVVASSAAGGASLRKFNPFAGRVGPQGSPVSAGQSSSAPSVTPVPHTPNLFAFNSEPMSATPPFEDIDASESRKPAKRLRTAPKPRATPKPRGPPKSRAPAKGRKSVATKSAAATSASGKCTVSIDEPSMSTSNPSETVGTSSNNLDTGVAENDKGKQRAL